NAGEWHHGLGNPCHPWLARTAHANLDWHFRLFLRRLGRAVLSSRYPPQPHARLLLRPLPPGRAELHLLPPADGGDAGPDRGADARGVPVSRQAAPFAPPRGSG